MVMEECHLPLCLDHVGIILDPGRFQSKWQSNRIPGCWLRSSNDGHGGYSSKARVDVCASQRSWWIQL